jgi:hypothetical protein|nr:MAG TPA: hypothetical protein [Caudoviricetes sp.]
MIYLSSNYAIKPLPVTKPIRDKRALITTLFNSDGTVDYYIDQEMLNSVIEPFCNRKEKQEPKEY